jgi:hypothetical protein
LQTSRKKNVENSHTKKNNHIQVKNGPTPQANVFTKSKKKKKIKVTKSVGFVLDTGNAQEAFAIKGVVVANQASNDSVKVRHLGVWERDSVSDPLVKGHFPRQAHLSARLVANAARIGVKDGLDAFARQHELFSVDGLRIVARCVFLTTAVDHAHLESQKKTKQRQYTKKTRKQNTRQKQGKENKAQDTTLCAPQ